MNLPEGWDYDKVFGEQAVSPMQRAALQKGSAQYAAVLAAPAPAADRGPGMALPQTATDAPALIHSGIIALLLAIALGALWWLQRHWAATAWARRSR
ncbi:hypothetical protein [Parvibaculum sp.]|uniref:hypothetical protein n=1 Tax=Parvibaculum sp. TaxID=2024848 RepID=UPI003BAB5E3E